MTIRTIDDLEVSGRTVMLRLDLNVPLEHTDAGAHITDDGRIRAALPTLRELSGRGARTVVLAHLGRPKTGPDPHLSLKPVAARLGQLLGRPVSFESSVTGPDVSAAVGALHDGDVLMLENVRFDTREASKDAAQRQALAREWATLADLFVSDGFGVVHRKQASVTDLAELLPHAAGYLVATEARVFQRVLESPERPYVVVLGGAKVSDKLGVIDHLLDRVDRLIIGGGMCFTFLAAQGHAVGTSLLEADQMDTVRGFLDRARLRGIELVLPVDVVVSQTFSADGPTQVVPVDAIPDGWMGLDIGPASIDVFRAALHGAKTVVWNGPMGVFEMQPFAAGTREVANAIADLGTMTVVGGGDSAAAVRLLNIGEERFAHISTGGGASLEYLEGKTLPGLAVLDDQETS